MIDRQRVSSYPFKPEVVLAAVDELAALIRSSFLSHTEAAQSALVESAAGVRRRVAVRPEKARGAVGVRQAPDDGAEPGGHAAHRRHAEARTIRVSRAL